MPIRLRSIFSLATLLIALPATSCTSDSAIAEQSQPASEKPVVDGDGAAGTITVTPTTTFQTIDGFGTSMRLWDDPHLNGESPQAMTGGMVMTPAQKDTIYDLLYSPTRGIGLNRLRVHMIEPGWQTREGGPIVTEAPYPGPHAAAQMDLIKKAKLRNPELRTGFQIGRFDNWITTATYPLVIAKYIKTALDYARANGHEPDWVGVGNEPSALPPFRSGANLRDISIELKNILKADGYATRLSIPDDIRDSDGAAKSATILEDPNARAAIEALSIHLYEDESPTAMAAVARQYDLPLWMTEFSDHESNTEISWALIIHEMLVTYNCSAVDMLFGFFKAAIGGYNSATYIGLYSTGTTYKGYAPSPSYYETGQWSKYVTRGSVRIDAISSNPAVKVSAFTRNGKKIIVLINSAATSESMSIPAGTYRAIRTQISGKDRLTDKGLFNTAVTLPRMSITTLLER